MFQIFLGDDHHDIRRVDRFSMVKHSPNIFLRAMVCVYRQVENELNRHVGNEF